MNPYLLLAVSAVIHTITLIVLVKRREANEELNQRYTTLADHSRNLADDASVAVDAMDRRLTSLEGIHRDVERYLFGVERYLFGRAHTNQIDPSDLIDAVYTETCKHVRSNPDRIGEASLTSQHKQDRDRMKREGTDAGPPVSHDEDGVPVDTFGSPRCDENGKPIATLAEAIEAAQGGPPATSRHGFA